MNVRGQESSATLVPSLYFFAYTPFALSFPEGCAWGSLILSSPTSWGIGALLVWRVLS